MKIETKLFGYLTVPFLIFGTVYGVWTKFKEPIGITAIYLTAIMCLFVAFYLGATARKMDARPDDNPFGEIADAAGDYGTFSPYSWWPLWLAAAAAMIFAGIAVGFWLAVIGAVFGVWALIGWVFEYYHGEYAN